MGKGGAAVEEVVESSGPNMWAVAVDNEIPSQHWEYHMRKHANEGAGDAAYNNLVYQPCCACIPVCEPKCKTPLFVW
eukprot:CAMPEP_0196571112 /NCGR_PEP_ID=MMETSP1081-20130531/1278_1 /TAXON_ID=36882 /ORGANISM="Pyramimonas amylifera, Strain CCMP720" /LENGTH=76 /DNA_ID=CAMNT_0041887895 /DNA_START=182 /DNA_END=409 /DNA_ORIENTATION=-